MKGKQSLAFAKWPDCLDLHTNKQQNMVDLFPLELICVNFTGLFMAPKYACVLYSVKFIAKTSTNTCIASTAANS